MAPPAVAAESGIGESLVRPVIRRLEVGGLLRRLSRMGGMRSEQNYQLSPSAEWAALVTLGKALAASGKPERAARHARTRCSVGE